MRVKDLSKISNLYIEAADTYCVKREFSNIEAQVGYDQLASLTIFNGTHNSLTTLDVNEIRFLDVKKSLSKVTNLFKEELKPIEEDLYTFFARNSKNMYANCVFVSESEREFNVFHYGAHLTSKAEVTVLVTPGDGKTILGWKNGKLHLHDSQINLVKQDVPLTYAGQMFFSKHAMMQLDQIALSSKITTIDKGVFLVERIDVLDIVNHFSEVNFILT